MVQYKNSITLLQLRCHLHITSFIELKKKIGYLIKPIIKNANTFDDETKTNLNDVTEIEMFQFNIKFKWQWTLTQKKTTIKHRSMFDIQKC